MNLISLQIWNNANMVKLLWNLSGKADNIWIRWIHYYYIKPDNHMTMSITTTCSWILKVILKQRAKAQQTQVLQKADNNKKFPTNNMYHAIKDYHQEPLCRKLCYGNMARPRAEFAQWIVCPEKLASRERLHRFRLIANDKCCFCSSVEILKHIFFKCIALNKIQKEVMC